MRTKYYLEMIFQGLCSMGLCLNHSKNQFPDYFKIYFNPILYKHLNYLFKSITINGLHR